MTPAQAREIEDKLRIRRQFFDERESIANFNDPECEVRVGEFSQRQSDQAFITKWEPVQDVMLKQLDDAIARLDADLAKFGITIE
ncbi:MAG: hypothetical protein AAGD43_16325 [Pseudomonadota bacterium]